MSDYPPPLVPADVDLRDFPFTPMFRSRLFGSSFHSRATDAEWRAGVTLWLKSWDQVPAGTLPDDDIDLCRLAELARDMKTWMKLRAGAMRGWILCSDGRLHHPVVAEGVLDAWERRSAAKRKGKAGASARWSVSNGSGNAPAIAQAMPGDSKGQGQGQGQGEDDPSDHQSAAVAPLDLTGEPPPKKARTKSVAVVAPLPDWIPADAWEAFCEMRKGRRNPVSAGARTVAIRELGKLRDAGQDVRAVLEQSTLRGWSGLFEIKGAAPARSGAAPPPMNRVERTQAELDQMFIDGAFGTPPDDLIPYGDDK